MKINPSQAYPLEVRISVWEDAGKMCHYCDKPLPKPGTKAGRRTQMDHKVPHAHGGSLDKDNLIITCRMCNLEKGKKTYEEYIYYRLERTKKHLLRLNHLAFKIRHG